MTILSHILSSVALLLGSVFGYGQHLFGTTLTTINGTDQISLSRATINSNFTALNTGKIEVGTTSVASITTLSGLTTAAALATVGTITSGTWSATPITVAEQGTGTTSPTLNAIMFGNGASGFKVVSFGNNGQFLTSGGAGAAPTWTSPSIDTTISYNFTGSYVGVKNLLASSTSANPITLNTLTYNTPSVRAASSTVLSEDGSGNLTWDAQDWQLLSATTTTAAMGIATTTVSGSHQDLRVVIHNPNAITGGATNYNLLFNSDVGSNYNYSYTSFFGSTDTASLATSQLSLAGQGSATTSPAYIDIRIKNVSTLVKSLQWNASLYSSATAPPGVIVGAATWNNTSSVISTIVLRAGGGTTFSFPAGMSIQIYGSRN